MAGESGELTTDRIKDIVRDEIGFKLRDGTFHNGVIDVIRYIVKQEVQRCIKEYQEKNAND